MSRSLAPGAALALSLAFLAGCADAPPTAPGREALAPSFRAEHFIQLVNFMMGGDPDNPLALQAGFDPGTTAQQVCDDPVGHGITGEGTIIFTPAGGIALRTADRDADLVVYQFGGGPVTGPCDLVGAPVVATGTGKFTYLTSVAPNGVTIIHVTVQGRVELVAGGEARLWASARVNLQRDGTLLFDEERVRLTPL